MKQKIKDKNRWDPIVLKLLKKRGAPEFVKRAGFVMMCALSVHDKDAKNKDFEKFFPIIRKECKSERTKQTN